MNILLGNLGQKTYKLTRLPDGSAIVTVNEGELDPRFDIVRLNARQPERAFSWGRLNADCAQLAVALIADCCGDEGLAKTLYSQFAMQVLADLMAEESTLTSNDIYSAIQNIEATYSTPRTVRVTSRPSDK